MWFMWFTVGSVWFWSLGLIWLILLTALVENEASWWSFWSVVIFVGIVHLFGDAQWFSYLQENPLDVLRYGLSYVGIGICWGVIKFYFYNSKLQRTLEDLKFEFNETERKSVKPQVSEGIAPHKYEDALNAARQKAWERYVDCHLDREDKQRLTLTGQTHRVVFWMAYWPVSAFWTLLNDPLRRLGNWLYDLFLVRIFKYIHEKTVGKALKLDV